MYVLLIVTYLQKQSQDRTLQWKDYLLLMLLRRRRGTPLLTCSATSRPPPDRSHRTVWSKCQAQAQVKRNPRHSSSIVSPHQLLRKFAVDVQCTLYICKNICRRENQINRSANRYLCHLSEKGPFPILGTLLFESLYIFPGVLQKTLFIIFH